jgi:hypothetical protein
MPKNYQISKKQQKPNLVKRKKKQRREGKRIQKRKRSKDKK